MQIVSCVVFEKVSSITGLCELDILKRAFNTVDRLFNEPISYPDLVERLAPMGIGKYDALGIANSFTHRSSLMARHYLLKGELILKLVDESLVRDIEADYSPATQDFVGSLIQALEKERIDIRNALSLLFRAIDQLDSPYRR